MKLSRRRFLRVAGTLAGSITLPRWFTSASRLNAQPYQVVLAQATTYDRTVIHNTVFAMLDQLGGLGDVVRPGDRVAIKINLTGGTGSMQNLPTPATSYYLTHPEVVRALCEAVRDAGARELYLVEGAWDSRSWENTGYNDVARDCGAAIINLNEARPYDSFVEVPVGDGGLIYDSFQLNGILTDIDVFMSVAKMKCHSGCGVTLSMKNLIGIVPISRYMNRPQDGRRSALHGEGSEYRTRLPRVVVDLNRARPIDFALIDGIRTSQAGEGPWVPGFGPITANVLVAGKNPVAADAVATAVMGFHPEAESLADEPFTYCENHLQLAADAGLGSNRLQEIEILGAALDDVRVSFQPSIALG
ncbi:MAG: DUF362 domain-containing protein [Anaerolineae bacterium]|nr:DUF362 domain-containing protein [Anaerolineae bacterium]